MADEDERGGTDVSEDIRSLLDDVADFIAMVDAPKGCLVSPEMRDAIGRRVDTARAVLARERIDVAWCEPVSEPAEPRYFDLPRLRVEGAPLIDDKEPWRWGL
jgi:hypothetical protein